MTYENTGALVRLCFTAAKLLSAVFYYLVLLWLLLLFLAIMSFCHTNTCEM